MSKCFAGKLQAGGGDPQHSQLVRFGASRQIGGVTLATVPALHANKAATHGGADIPGTRSAEFIASTKTKGHVPLSDRPMAFDGAGRCVWCCD